MGIEIWWGSVKDTRMVVQKVMDCVILCGELLISYLFYPIPIGQKILHV
jgi:hypothetical protein